jgi:DNA-directed RNA polymerase subunit RPC12/RpoP
MNIRCNYCRHSFNLSRDYLAQAVAEAEEKHQKYYGVECFNCRKLIKVPVLQMKHALPPQEVEEEEPAESAD